MNQKKLESWMVNNQVTGNLLRSVLPADGTLRIAQVLADLVLGVLQQLCGVSIKPQLL